MPFCQNCGKEYTQVGIAFCPNCGKSLQGASVQQTAVKYCQKCGAANDAGVAYCQHCGEMIFGSTAPSRVSRPLGITILGAIQIIGSIAVLMIGVGLSFLLGPLSIFMFPLAVLPLLFAVSLFTGRNWARVLMMIGAVLDILSIVGVIWGALLLWYLTRPHVVAYFKQPK
ncbi:MAG: zinc ribbon domain-containing protein [Thaumarchaeota archaeon]|nr:zinc ribbon domain-containing protein [Nitrososphaerota archaeon]